ncbi:hypothetical protein Zm00014a_003960 [Zea mays]|uniref:Uncharacterized protein n=2 Tax=Zea mays TaxID=4577 RepID=A0A1D6QE31_MAIZE|nr:hypothetical protein ZEAMMB73_Zm00001d052176 [Zea mays]PWZ28038.1 hypothetical protein Zm00014a_003960 [Zea mays]
MARGIARASSFGGRATTPWCSCRHVTVDVCLGKLVAALLVLRSLTAPAPRFLRAHLSQPLVPS